MRLEGMPVAARLELRRIRAVFLAVEAHDAQEEIIRQPAHRLAVAHVRGHEPAAHHAARVRIDVNERDTVPLPRGSDGGHDTGWRAAIDADFRFDWRRRLGERSGCEEE